MIELKELESPNLRYSESEDGWADEEESDDDKSEDDEDEKIDLGDDETEDEQ